MKAIDAVGGTPYIALKSNTKGREGSALRRLYHRFMAAPDEFLKHYHKRSSVETVFSTIKRRFGHDLLSKTETAMINETLVKILCHNLAVLNYQMHVLGIEPTFWERKKAA